MSFLTDEQKAELKKDRDAVIAANPDLGKKLEDLHQQMRDARDSGDKPSEDLMSQMKAAQDELDAAVIKLDSAAAPIIAEIKAHHHGRGPGPGPGPNGQTDSTSGGGRTPPPDGGN